MSWKISYDKLTDEQIAILDAHLDAYMAHVSDKIYSFVFRDRVKEG